MSSLISEGPFFSITLDELKQSIPLLLPHNQTLEPIVAPAVKHPLPAHAGLAQSDGVLLGVPVQAAKSHRGRKGASLSSALGAIWRLFNPFHTGRLSQRQLASHGDLLPGRASHSQQSGTNSPTTKQYRLPPGTTITSPKFLHFKWKRGSKVDACVVFRTKWNIRSSIYLLAINYTLESFHFQVLWCLCMKHRQMTRGQQEELRKMVMKLLKKQKTKQQLKPNNLSQWLVIWMCLLVKLVQCL